MSEMQARLAFKSTRKGVRRWGYVPHSCTGVTVGFRPDADVPDDIVEVGQTGTLSTNVDGTDARFE